MEWEQFRFKESTNKDVLNLAKNYEWKFAYTKHNAFRGVLDNDKPTVFVDNSMNKAHHLLSLLEKKKQRCIRMERKVFL